MLNKTHDCLAQTWPRMFQLKSSFLFLSLYYQLASIAYAINKASLIAKELNQTPKEHL